jgi:hypothetical protein
METTWSSEALVNFHQTAHDDWCKNLEHYYIKNSVDLSLQANSTDWSTATCRWNLMQTFVARGVSRGQRGGSLTVIYLSFLDRSRYFPFK